jgi:hypothetical protein
VGCAERHRTILTPDAGPEPVGAADASVQPTPARDGGPRTAAIGCDDDGGHYLFGERFTKDSQQRACRCDATGVECQTACCKADATQCDGGPCTTCKMGLQTFPVGASLTCSDGCNTCVCTAYGSWLETLVACVSVPPQLERCPQPTAAEPSSLVFVDPTADGRVELRTRFARGGCELYPPDVRGCYQLDAEHVAHLWMEPLSSLADCEVPFIAERVFDLATLRQELMRTTPDGSTVIAVGPETISVAF